MRCAGPLLRVLGAGSLGRRPSRAGMNEHAWRHGDGIGLRGAGRELQLIECQWLDFV